MRGRIVFSDNPWPDGHAIKRFELRAALSEKHGVGLLMHLETAAYDAEGAGRDGEGDWGAPATWLNYHACTISNTEWGYLADQLVRLDAPPRPFDWRELDGRSIGLDPVAALAPDWSPTDQPFQIYLLGHDAVADHVVDIRSGSEPGLFDVRWRGRIALFYTGQETFDHRFEADIRDAPFAGFELDLEGAPPNGRAAAAAKLAREFLVDPEAWRLELGATATDADHLVRAAPWR
jgi:hypothetical protein